MAKRVKLLRHTQTQADLFKGLEGEITVDLTNHELRVHDDITKGGFSTARKDLANVISATVSNDGKMTATQVSNLVSVMAGLAQEIIDRGLNVDAEETRALAAELVLQNDIDTRIPLSQKSVALGVASLNAIGKVSDIALQADSLTDVTASAAQINALTTVAGTGKLEAFDAGTIMAFQSTNAPTGWVKEVTHNNKALRIVTGAASSGGVVPFTTAFSASNATEEHVLTVAETPAHDHTAATAASAGSHSHTYPAGDSAGGATQRSIGSTSNTTVHNATTNAAGAHTHNVTMASVGGGLGHSHTMALAVQYVDLILAAKAS